MRDTVAPPAGPEAQRLPATWAPRSLKEKNYPWGYCLIGLFLEDWANILVYDTSAWTGRISSGFPAGPTAA